MTDMDHPEGTLQQGAWLPEVHTALLDLIRDHGNRSPSYDSRKPPLAVIDCDDTLLRGDLAEAFLRHLVNRRIFKTDRGFWQVIPERMGRDALSAAHRAVAGRADNEVTDTAAFRRFRAGMLGAFEGIRANDGLEAAYVFAARLLKGQHERTVAELAEEIISQELERQVSLDDIPAGPPFGPLTWSIGLRPHLEMLDLIHVLEASGFQTWIMSAAHLPLVKALARHIQFAEERVLGLELQTQSGVYTEKVLEPVPVGEGKLELFLDTVGRSPVLVLGDSTADWELFENCEGLSIYVDRGDEPIAAKATECGFMVQPSTFSY